METKRMSLLLKLLSVLDEYNSLKKELYKLEHSKVDIDNTENVLLKNTVMYEELNVTLMKEKVEVIRELQSSIVKN
jgi:hypothetical protein